jgi:hypothetical protein
MQLTINIPDSLVETVVKGLMENMPECSTSMRCLSWGYDKWAYKFEDDDGKLHTLGKVELLATFPLLFTDKWPKSFPSPPISDNAQAWDQWLCDCDADCIDAYVQLACFKEVVYG